MHFAKRFVHFLKACEKFLVVLKPPLWLLYMLRFRNGCLLMVSLAEERAKSRRMRDHDYMNSIV